MDRLKRNWQWILFFLMGIVIIVLYEYSAKQRAMFEEEIKFQQTQAIRDSIHLRRIIRSKEDAAFLYRDSLRQQRIDYITLQNEKTKKYIREVIRILPNSDTDFRDSLWTAEWAREDSAAY